MVTEVVCQFLDGAAQPPLWGTCEQPSRLLEHAVIVS